MNYNELPGIRATTLKAFLNPSARAARAKLEESADNAAFRFGRAVHVALEKGIDAVPHVEDIRSKERKALYFANEACTKGKDREQLEDMISAFEEQCPEEVKEAKLKGLAEEVVTTKDGVFKAQIDLLHGSLAIDYKTTSAFNVNEIMKQAVNHGHFLQAYHYKLCCPQIKRFMFVYLMKNAPYDVLCLEMGPEHWDFGAKQWSECYELYLSGEDRNECYNKVVAFPEIPNYLKGKEEAF